MRVRETREDVSVQKNGRRVQGVVRESATGFALALSKVVRNRPKTIVFPFNGTRRWFLLEHGREEHDDPAQAYIELTSKRYVEMYQMLFDYGLDTIIAPVFGGEILNRGDEYMDEIGVGITLLAEHPYFASFYEKYDVRVSFYGDYCKKLSSFLQYTCSLTLSL